MRIGKRSHDTQGTAIFCRLPLRRAMRFDRSDHDHRVRGLQGVDRWIAAGGMRLSRSSPEPEAVRVGVLIQGVVRSSEPAISRGFACSCPTAASGGQRGGEKYRRDQSRPKSHVSIVRGRLTRGDPLTVLHSRVRAASVRPTPNEPRLVHKPEPAGQRSPPARGGGRDRPCYR